MPCPFCQSEATKEHVKKTALGDAWSGFLVSVLTTECIVLLKTGSVVVPIAASSTMPLRHSSAP